MHESVGLDINNIAVSQDIHTYHCGVERCLPSHSFGPAVRDHFLLHFVLDGEGFFEVDGKKYWLKKNQAFLIVPNVVTYYEASKSNPWHYTWVGFNGLKALDYLKSAGITRQNPIYPSEHNIVEIEIFEGMKKCIFDMVQTCSINQRSRDLHLQSLLYQLMAFLMDGSAVIDETFKNYKLQDMYIDEAVRFIATNYSRKISIIELAKYVGIDRTYLYDLFIKRYQISPKEFLIRFRMQKASELLRQPSLPIGAVSHSVGYEDQLTFSRMFKKMMGSSPLKFREANIL